MEQPILLCISSFSWQRVLKGENYRLCGRWDDIFIAFKMMKLIIPVHLEGYILMQLEYNQSIILMGWLCKNCNFEVAPFKACKCGNIENNWLCRNENWCVPKFKACPKCNNIEDNWTCKNCKRDVPKFKACPKCSNIENNWACTTCHVCNPNGNNMKRCGGGNYEQNWWFVPKFKACKCGNIEACWRCYNCDFNNPKFKACKCGNIEDHWRCNNCNLDIAKFKSCKCGNKQ